MFRRPAGGTHEDGTALRRARRRTLPVAILVVGLLWGGLAWLEHTRHEDADRLFDRLADQTAATVEDFFDAHLAMQRVIANDVDPDAVGAFGHSFAVTYVDFAILLDADATIRALHPERADLQVGDTLAGRFPHIDAVRDGASEAFWATDQAATGSGVVVAAAIPAPGGILTVAFDPSGSGLPDALRVVTNPLPGWQLEVVEPATGTVVLDMGLDPTEDPVQRDRTTARGWQVRLTADYAGVDALAGGAVLLEGRMVALLLSVLVLLGWWRLPTFIAARREVAHLRRSAEDLEASREELRQVGGRLAHDLLNPLTAIHGLSKVLVTVDLPPERRVAALDQIHQSTSGLLQLVRSLMDRADQLGGEEAEAVDLGELHDFLQRLVGPDLAHTGGSVDLDTDLRTVHVPPGALRTILVNLVVNALKYARDEVPPRVVVHVRVVDGQLLVSVIDNGRGVPPGQLERIFEPGVRVDTQDGTGRGSGLAEVRRLVTLSGGRAWATANDPHGLQVHVVLPHLASFARTPAAASA